MQCASDGCTAETLPRSRRCLAHASDAKRRSFLEAVRGQAGLGDRLRGLRIEPPLLAALMPVIPSLPGRLDLTGCLFPEAVTFEGVSFAHDVCFAKATFSKRVSFAGATFCGDADFVGAEFEGDALFERVRLKGRMNFQTC